MILLLLIFTELSSGGDSSLGPFRYAVGRGLTNRGDALSREALEPVAAKVPANDAGVLYPNEVRVFAVLKSCRRSPMYSWSSPKIRL